MLIRLFFKARHKAPAFNEKKKTTKIAPKRYPKITL